MSQDTNTELPSVEAAQAYVMQNLFAPAYFDKLSQYGIVPADATEAREMLDIGFMIHETESNPEMQKSAGVAPAVSEVHQLHGALSSMLGVSKTAEANETRKLAAAAATDTNLYLAALAIKSAEFAQQ